LLRIFYSENASHGKIFRRLRAMQMTVLSIRQLKIPHPPHFNFPQLFFQEASCVHLSMESIVGCCWLLLLLMTMMMVVVVVV